MRIWASSALPSLRHHAITDPACGPTPVPPRHPTLPDPVRGSEPRTTRHWNGKTRINVQRACFESRGLSLHMCIGYCYTCESVTCETPSSQATRVRSSDPFTPSQVGPARARGRPDPPDQARTLKRSGARRTLAGIARYVGCHWCAAVVRGRNVAGVVGVGRV